MAFIQVATIPVTTNISHPMDLWAGFGGLGYDGKLFLTTGGRQTASKRGGGIFSHDDEVGDTNWVKELELGDDCEVIGKIRDWKTSVGQHRLYAYLEGPLGGQKVVTYRLPGSPTWTPDPDYPDVAVSPPTIGSRSLGVNHWSVGNSDIWSGHTVGNGTSSPQARSRRRKADGSGSPVWALQHSNDNVFLWDTEYDTSGNVWEFYVIPSNPFGYTSAPVLVNGVSVAAPEAGARDATYFVENGAMFICERSNSSTQDWIARWNGSGWTRVFTRPGDADFDHVLYVPRGGGELWVTTYRTKLRIYKSTNGTSFSLEHGPSSFSTGSDGNSLTAIGYYNGRVWVAARDNDANLIRIYREDIEISAGMSQVI